MIFSFHLLDEEKHKNLTDIIKKIIA